MKQAVKNKDSSKIFYFNLFFTQKLQYNIRYLFQMKLTNDISGKDKIRCSKLQ